MSNVTLTRHRLPLEFAEKGGNSSYTRGDLSGPMLSGIVLGLFGISESWLALPAAWRRLSQSRVAAERLQALLTDPQPSTSSSMPADALSHPEPVWPARAPIHCENLHFAWAVHQPAVFTGLDLEIASGERVAVVGESGCGKTTLLRLIMGQITSQKGTVMIGDQCAHTISPELSQQRIAYLPQNPVLFRDTVAGNLLLAKPAARDAELIEVLNQAGLSHWLASLPMGLNTWIDEAAGNLSGVEKRRLALARLFLCDPEIVLLDEPAASLDDATLTAINQSLDHWLANRTTLLITHRADALPPVDRVIRLEQCDTKA